MPDHQKDAAGEETANAAHAAGAAAEEQAEDNVDGEVEEALAVVEALLGGEDVEAFSLSEEALQEYESKLSKHCDYLEASLREELDVISETEGKTIGDIVSVMKVCINGLLHELSLPRALSLCRAFSLARSLFLSVSLYPLL